jgi:tRNA splicing endonuclease
MISRKDAVRFGGDSLVYEVVHSSIVIREEEGGERMNWLEGQRWTRLCEAVKKRGVLKRGDEYVEIRRMEIGNK